MKLQIEINIPDGPSCDGCLCLRRYDFGAKPQCLLTGHMVDVQWAPGSDVVALKDLDCPNIPQKTGGKR